MRLGLLEQWQGLGRRSRAAEMNGGCGVPG